MNLNGTVSGQLPIRTLFNSFWPPLCDELSQLGWGVSAPSFLCALGHLRVNCRLFSMASKVRDNLALWFPKETPESNSLGWVCPSVCVILGELLTIVRVIRFCTLKMKQLDFLAARFSDLKTAREISFSCRHILIYLFSQKEVSLRVKILSAWIK